MGVKFKSNGVQTMQGQRNRGTVHTSWNVSFCQKGMHKKHTHIHVSSLICGEVLRWKFVERKKSTQHNKKKKIFLFTHIHDSHQPAVLLSVLASAKAAKCYALHNSLPVFLNTSRFYIYPFFSHPTTQDRTTHAIMSLQRRRKIKKYFFGQRSNRLQISAKRHAVIFVSF